jgi:hypothetical protein
LSGRRRRKEISLMENTSILSTTLELRRKLHLFVSIQQPPLYLLISHLKLEYTDIYLDSKVIKDNSIKDYADLCIFIKQKKNLERKVTISSSRLFCSLTFFRYLENVCVFSKKFPFEKRFTSL